MTRKEVKKMFDLNRDDTGDFPTDESVPGLFGPGDCIPHSSTDSDQFEPPTICDD